MMALQGGSNPLDSCFNFIGVLVRYPLESNFRKLANNFKNCFDGVVKYGNPIDYVNVEQLNMKRNKKICQDAVFYGEDGGKGKFRVKIVLGNYTGKCGNIDNNFSFSSDLVGKADPSCNDGEIKPRELKIRAGKKGLSLEHLKRLIFGQLSHFPMFKVGVQAQEFNTCYESSTGHGNQFDHFKALCSIFRDNEEHFRALLMNSKFARVRGGLSIDVHSVKEIEEESVGGAVNEGNVGENPRQKLVKEMPGVPISSCNHLRNGYYISVAADFEENINSAVEVPRDSVLKSALAGGLSCALSASIMHPVDTVKTWVQASSTLTFLEVMSKLPQYGVRALYRGSIPAILGQFSSHGLRTGICEACKLVLVNIAPGLPLMQVEAVSSFCGTFLGTAMRIPCEVLKQRLQAGLFENVGQAVAGTWRQDGAAGFFRGTAATLCREIPFYVAGMGLYAESKKAARRLIGRELQAWETLAVGALSGGLTAVLTTPIDVIKTRMMVAGEGQTGTVSFIVLSILKQEGPVGLFKGSVPRFFWVAPLGAMNFAGYELLRKAMG